MPVDTTLYTTVTLLGENVFRLSLVIIYIFLLTFLLEHHKIYTTTHT